MGVAILIFRGVVSIDRVTGTWVGEIPNIGTTVSDMTRAWSFWGKRPSVIVKSLMCG